MPPLFRPDEQWEADEHGNVNWAAAWRKELQSLLQATDQQDKAGEEQEWYRQMLIKVRTGMLTPVTLEPVGGAEQTDRMERTYPAGVTSWIDLEQPDVDAAQGFYSALLGWHWEERMPEGVR